MIVQGNIGIGSKPRPNAGRDRHSTDTVLHHERANSDA